MRTSIGGSRVRIRLSNLFGAEPVRIGPIHVAMHARGSTIVPETTRPVTFNGTPTVTVAAGAAALSDPVAFPVIALQELAVSFYLPSRVAISTVHGTALQTAFITQGDQAAEAVWSNADTDTSRFFLTDVEVEADAPAGAVVIMGDSITDGVGSTRDANRRWSDALAERLQADPALASIAVVNAGIAGNRILNDGVEPFIGPSSLSRFDRDALDKPGVRWVILLQGSNDISASDMLDDTKGSRDRAPDHRRHADAHRTGSRARHPDLGCHDASARRRAETVCDDCRGHRRSRDGERLDPHQRRVRRRHRLRARNARSGAA